MPPFLLDDLLSELPEKQQSYFVEIGQQKQKKKPPQPVTVSL